MIDSHCHLTGEEFASDRSEVIERAMAMGVETLLSVACHPDEYTGLLAFLESYPSFYGAFGIHPEVAALCPSEEELAAYFTHPRLVGIGETGLDYHYTPETAKQQQESFQRHINVAYRLKKPLVIHSREAEADTIALLKEAERGGLLAYGGVLHCFTGSDALADQALSLGLFLSVSGVISFRNAHELRQVFQHIPLDRLLVETDAPYLAPTPYRGRRNEPAFVVQTATVLADLKGVSVDEMSRQTSSNFNKLFLKRGAEHED